MQHESYGADVSSFAAERDQYSRSSVIFEDDIWTLRNKKSVRRKCAASLNGPQSVGGNLERAEGGVPSGNAQPWMSVGHPEKATTVGQLAREKQAKFHTIESAMPLLAESLTVMIYSHVPLYLVISRPSL